MIETRIFIREAAERNCHPTIMFGRFGDGKNFPPPRRAGLRAGEQREIMAPAP